MVLFEETCSSAPIQRDRFRSTWGRGAVASMSAATCRFTSAPSTTMLPLHAPEGNPLRANTAKEMFMSPLTARQRAESRIRTALATLLLFSSGATPLMAASTVTCADFTAGPNSRAGESPVAIALGDFKADGHVDLVVANSTSSVTTVIGDGRGNFTTGYTTDFGFTAQPTALATAEFNGDKYLDLVVAHLSANEFGTGVFTLLSFGNGKFAAAVHHATPGVPQAIGVGDFDGNGKTDIAVASHLLAQPGNVSILLANGGAAFAPAVSYAVGHWPAALAIGDWNGDQKPDLAVGNSDSSTVSILTGNGDGTFALPVNHEVDSRPTSIATADVNRDGRTDLVVGNVVAQTVSVLMGNDSGGFSPAVAYNAGAPLRSVNVGDFNADGKLDIAAAANSDSGGGIIVLPGNGDGSFGPPCDYRSAGNPGPLDLAIGDFNVDGRPDIATTNFISHDVGVFLNAPAAAVESDRPRRFRRLRGGNRQE
jgi:hypothetical protein